MSVTRVVLQTKAAFVATMFVASVVMAPVALACDKSAVTEKSNNGNAYAYGQDKKDDKDSKNKPETPVASPEQEQKSENGMVVKEATEVVEQVQGQIGEAASTTTPSVSTQTAQNTTHPTGNNGTLKVHEYATESAFINNDPKVCMFNFEGFGFDIGQDGYIMIEGQGQTKTIYGPYNFGPTTASEKYRSYAQTMYFNRDGNPTIPNGHYKATLYGKDNSGILNLKDEKAKSKVFKVSCESTPTAPTTLTDPVDPSNPGTGDVEGAETVSQPTTNTNTPATLPSTGSEIAFMAAIAGTIAGFVGIVSYLLRYTYLKIS